MVLLYPAHSNQTLGHLVEDGGHPFQFWDSKGTIAYHLGWLYQYYLRDQSSEWYGWVVGLPVGLSNHIGHDSRNTFLFLFKTRKHNASTFERELAFVTTS